ncbi:MAG TPA: type II secretion system protein [Gemmataceae bacterium]|jgi:prepilin-type N-terminal cleavage/methylation domain-containing protein|nr:type II secretion system protein [Gemmataceae bacterium]
MMFHNESRYAGPKSRAAFTLIELLIVITIIAVLTALTAGAYWKVTDSQKKSNTVMAVQKIAGALDQQWQAVIDQARTETLPQSVLDMSAVNKVPSPRRARIIWVKLRLKQEFPMNFDEAWAPSGPGNPYLGPKPAYAAAIGPPPYTMPGPTSSPPSSAQSAVLLYLILQEHRRGMNFNVDTELSTREAGDAGPGLKQLVDAWGTPLAFIRWPWQSQDLNPHQGEGEDDYPTGGQPPAGLNDAQDPEGLLSDPNWVGSPGWSIFIQLCHPVGAKASYKLVPVVASAGRDKTWGINLTTMQTQDPSIAGDNIYNFIARLGSKGT